jgi:hypothetical protein
VPDAINNTIDIIGFSMAGLVGFLVAWKPRAVARVLGGRRRASQVSDAVIRFDRFAGALMAAGTAWALFNHFVLH